MPGTYFFGQATPAVKDSSEAGTIVEGTMLTRAGVSDTPALGLGERQPVKIAAAGDAFYGSAFADPDLQDGLTAVHAGIVPAVWDAVSTLVNDDPVKLANAGKITRWLDTDNAKLIIGFLESREVNDAFVRLGVR